MAYFPARHIGFIWDDDTHLTQNIVIGPGGLWKSWFTTEQPNYWPVTWTAFWLQWKVFGLNPAGYHTVNVLLHGLNALLCWRVLQRLAVPGAWIAALFFALHPVNVETAAWVTQLKSLLAMTFYLASLLCYLRSEAEPGCRWYGVSIPLFLAGMLSKPSIVTMPLVLLLIAWWKRGRLNRHDLVRSLPFFAISAVLSLTEIWFQYTRSIQDTVVRTDDFLSRLAGAGWVVWFYASKIYVPVNLMFVYPRWEHNTSSPVTWLPLAFVAALAAGVWMKRSTWGRSPLVAFAYFIVTLLPVLGFLNIYYMRYSFVADHWQYQSMIGPVAFVSAIAVSRLASRPRVLHSAVTVTALLLTALTWNHLRVYRSVETLWRETLRANPGAWIAHQCLGEHLSRQGRLDEAIRHFEAELKVVPDFAEPHYNLGIAYAARGDLEKAVAHYRRAIELNPKSAEAHNNCGVALTAQKRWDEAVGHFQLAVAINSAYAEAYTNWGLALAEQGRKKEALVQYRKALELDPDSGAAHTNAGAALLALNRPGEAVVHFREAVRVDPRSPSVHSNLGYALLAAGEAEEALTRFETALQLAPGHARAAAGLQRASEGAASRLRR